MNTARLAGRSSVVMLLVAFASVSHAQPVVPDVEQTEVQQLEAERTALDARIVKAREAAAQRTIATFEAMRPAADAAQALLKGSSVAAPAPALPVKTVAVVAPQAATSAIETVADIEEANGKRKFGGLEFGVGISATFDIGTNDRISAAEVVNGLVRVTDSDNSRARIMFESHYFFKNTRRMLGLDPDFVGFGPFMALQPGTNEIIEAVAGGVMLGLRRKGGSESFNVGLGLVIDPNTRILGDDVVANRPLPAGEAEVRFKEEPQTGVVLLFSFGF